MNMNFKSHDRHLNIVHFQKIKVFWNQLTEFYQIRPVPDRVWKKGRTLFCDHSSKKQRDNSFLGEISVNSGYISREFTSRFCRN